MLITSEYVSEDARRAGEGLINKFRKMEKKIYEVPGIEVVKFGDITNLMAGSNGQDAVSGVKSDDVTWKDGGFEDDEPDC